MVLLSGCASQSVEPSYYLLRSSQDLPSEELKPSTDFSLGTIEIAPYLNQPGLVLDMTAAQIRPAANHLWAEPIYNGVRNLLTTEISIAIGQELLPTNLSEKTTVVNVRIDKLDGTLNGEARIVAYWSLVDSQGIISLYRFAESRALTTDGYGAMVSAEKALIVKLAEEIAASLIIPTSDKN